MSSIESAIARHGDVELVSCGIDTTHHGSRKRRLGERSMFASVWMCVTVRLGEVGPCKVSRHDAAFRFAFTSATVTAGAIDRRGWHFQITNHRHERFLTRNLAAQVNSAPTPLRRLLEDAISCDDSTWVFVVWFDPTQLPKRKVRHDEKD